MQERSVPNPAYDAAVVSSPTYEVPAVGAGGVTNPLYGVVEDQNARTVANPIYEEIGGPPTARVSKQAPVSEKVKGLFDSGVRKSLPSGVAENLVKQADFASIAAGTYIDTLSSGKVGERAATSAELIIAMQMMIAKGRAGEEEDRKEANKAWKGFQDTIKELSGPALLLQTILGNSPELKEGLFTAKPPHETVDFQQLLQSIRLSDNGVMKIPCKSKADLVNAIKCFAQDPDISTVTIRLANQIEMPVAPGKSELRAMNAETLQDIIKGLQGALGGQEGLDEKVLDFGDLGEASVGFLLNLKEEDFESALGEDGPKGGAAGYFTRLFGGKPGVDVASKDDVKDASYFRTKHALSNSILSVLKPEKSSSLAKRDKKQRVDRRMAVSAVKTAVIGLMQAKGSGGAVREALERLKQERNELLQIKTDQDNAEGLFGDLIKAMDDLHLEQLERRTADFEKMLDMLADVVRMSEVSKDEVVIPVAALKDNIKEQLAQGNSVRITLLTDVSGEQVEQLKGMAREALREAIQDAKKEGKEISDDVYITIAVRDEEYKIDRAEALKESNELAPATLSLPSVASEGGLVPQPPGGTSAVSIVEQFEKLAGIKIEASVPTKPAPRNQERPPEDSAPDNLADGAAPNASPTPTPTPPAPTD